MSPDAIVRQWFPDVWNEGREATLDRLMAPDYDFLTVYQQVGWVSLPDPTPAESES